MPPDAFAPCASHQLGVIAMVCRRLILDTCDSDAVYGFAAHNADFEGKFFQTPKPMICTYKVACVYGRTRQPTATEAAPLAGWIRRSSFARSRYDHKSPRRT